jgi:hypothetical protein
MNTPTTKWSNQYFTPADPFRMKVIAEAVGDYAKEHQLEDDAILNDFRFNLETAYQRHHNLDENDWAYVEEDREVVFGAF